MTIKDALRDAGIPAHEAEVLLAALLRHDRTWLVAHGDDALPVEREGEWRAWVARRRAHEPVAYITGEREFYGRTFAVDRRVLIPRPATETLVTEALRFLDDPTDRVTDADAGIVIASRSLRQLGNISTFVDVGTGSGCIAITLSLERPELTIIATDVDENILELARENAQRHGVESRIEFRVGNGLAPVRDLQAPFLLVSNPPYIPEGTELMEEVMNYEPHGALFGGVDGMTCLRALTESASMHFQCAGMVMECGENQIAVHRKRKHSP